MSDFFQEVDEALQQEKLLNIWNEYKNTIIAAIAILILSAAGTTAYHSWNNNRNAEETARLMQAMESDAPAQALPAIIEKSRKNHAAIATFISAGLAMEEDRKEDAAALYYQAAESSRTPRDLRDLARILYVQNAETPDVNILKPLLGNKKSPWVWHARIEAAVLAAQENDYSQALSHLSAFENESSITVSLKQRGTALAHVYRIKQGEADAAKAETE